MLVIVQRYNQKVKEIRKAIKNNEVAEVEKKQKELTTICNEMLDNLTSENKRIFQDLRIL